MSARARFELIKAEAIQRLRQRFHRQSDYTKDRHHRRNEWITKRDEIQQYMSREERAKILLQNRWAELSECCRHVLDGDPDAGTVARDMLFNFPKYTFEEDRKLALSIKLIRAARLLSVPPQKAKPVAMAVSMVATHTYALEAQTVAAFASAFFTIRPMPPNARDVFTALGPRITSLCPNFCVSECLLFLQAAKDSGFRNTTVLGSVGRNLAEFAETGTLSDVCEGCALLASLDPRSAAGTLNSILHYLEAEVQSLRLENIIHLFRAYARIQSGPRKFCHSLAEQVLRQLQDCTPTDLADILTSMRLMNHRHDPFLRRIAQRQLVLVNLQTSRTVAATLLTLAHFKVEEVEDVFATLGEKLEVSMSRSSDDLAIDDACDILFAFAHGGQWHAPAVGLAMKALKQGDTLKSASDSALLRGLIAMGKLGLFKNIEDMKSFTTVCDELTARGGLPTEEPELLDNVAAVVQFIVDDRSVHNDVLIALSPLAASTAPSNLIHDEAAEA